jgi:hypothetical protein
MIRIEEATEATSSLIEAFERLLPPGLQVA